MSLSHSTIFYRWIIQRWISCFIFIVFPVLVSSMSSSQEPVIDPKDPILKTYEPREFGEESGAVLRYRLLKPIVFSPDQKYPLIVFLHGAGERGSDNAAQLKHAARDLVAEDLRKKYPCYVVAPQCPKEKKWSEVDWSADESAIPEDPSESMRLLKGLIDSMVETAGVDKNRIYITGLSMGGYGTWDAIARYPDFFAAAAPVCGGGDPTTVHKFAALPVWCFHGGIDPVVKPERSRKMIEAMQAIGATPKYTEYPNVSHDSWTPTYKNPELYEWLFAQKRSPQEN
jgi:predicted peptidase